MKKLAGCEKILHRLKYFISSSHRQGPLHRHAYCWILKMMIQRQAYSPTGRASSLCCHWFFFTYLCKFFIYFLYFSYVFFL